MLASGSRHLSYQIWIYLAALAARLIPVLLTADLPIGLDDMFQYDMLARSLASGGGFRWYAETDLARLRPYLPVELPADYNPAGVPTSFRGPAYPFFLAFIYFIFGAGPHRFFFARLAQAFLTATVSPLAGQLAVEAGFSQRAARWSAGILAFYPILIAYPLALATENLFIPLLTLLLILILRAGRTQRKRDAILAGLCLGLAALTRSLITGLIPLVMIYWWFAAREKRTAAQNSLWLVLGFFLLTAPWAIRNSILHQRPTWLETSLGYNLYLGYHPQSRGAFQFGISMDLLPIVDDARRDDLGRQAAIGFIRADPARLPDLMLRKLAYFWGLDRRALAYFYTCGFFGHWPAWLLATAFLLDAGPLIALLPLGIIGLFCGSWGKPKSLLALMLVYYTGIHMLILAEPRFHLPLLPVIAVLAAQAFCERAWARAQSWQRTFSLALIALMVFNWVYEIVVDWSTIQLIFGPEGHNLHLNY